MIVYYCMSRSATLATFFLFIIISINNYGQSITVSGLITEKRSKESLPFVSIVTSTGLKNGTTSNAYGYYSITLQSNELALITFSHIGHKILVKEINVFHDTILNIELEPLIYQLNEVVIEDNAETWAGQSYHQIRTDVIKRTPALLGEKDVLKALQLLPGVQRGVEGSTVFYVRGGGADQNLILVDDATIYNANHLFGFVSIFNSDAIKNINFYKGSFPARYGGRIASVTDIQMKEGNREEIIGEGGIGILSGRLTIEGPLTKKNSSFLISTRRSFIDLITKPLMSDDDKVGYRLFDVNVKMNFDTDKRNRFSISGYMGGDNLQTKQKTERQQSTIVSETDLGWINRNGSIRWNHIFSDKIFTNTSLVYSHYNFFLRDTYRRTGTKPNYTHSEFFSKINDYTIKNDLDYFLSNHHTLKSGLVFTLHHFTPRSFYSKDEARSEEARTSQNYQTREAGFYLEDSWQVSDKMEVNAGIRMAHLTTKEKTYAALEPRAHLHYNVTAELKLNAGYTRTNQFMHLLSNTGVGLPTDLWVPVTSIAPPQQGDQFSAGISKSLNKNKYLLSIEAYRRYMRNILAYKQGATFLDTNELSEELQWENNITIGKGESYGTEFLFEKKTGKLTGWTAYTLSWVIHEFEDLNYGRRFFPRHDSRHNISLFCNFNLSKKVNVSANWQYSTGNAMTAPKAYYYGDLSLGNERRPVVMPDGSYGYFVSESITHLPYAGSVNSFRAADYHRLDLSIQIHKKKKHYDRYWEFGLYNAYNRKNPFYYYLERSNDFVNKGQRFDLKKKSLFPILPSVSYNFKF